MNPLKGKILNEREKMQWDLLQKDEELYLEPHDPDKPTFRKFNMPIVNTIAHMAGYLGKIEEDFFHITKKDGKFRDDDELIYGLFIYTEDGNDYEIWDPMDWCDEETATDAQILFNALKIMKKSTNSRTITI